MSAVFDLQRLPITSEPIVTVSKDIHTRTGTTFHPACRTGHSEFCKIISGFCVLLHIIIMISIKTLLIKSSVFNWFCIQRKQGPLIIKYINNTRLYIHARPIFRVTYAPCFCFFFPELKGNRIFRHISSYSYVCAIFIYVLNYFIAAKPSPPSSIVYFLGIHCKSHCSIFNFLRINEIRTFLC